MTAADLRRAGALARPVGRIARFLADLVGYGLVSAVALACDYSLLVGLVAAGLHYQLASFLSFSIGMLVAYALCTRFLFARRRAASRQTEAAGFFAVGVAGLALTQLMLLVLVSCLGLQVALAKIPTTAIVFVFNFLCRRSLVFAKAAAP